MGQQGFWDEEQRIKKLQDKKPVLVFSLLRFRGIPFYLYLKVAIARSERAMQ